MNAAEHLVWSTERAMEYINQRELVAGWSSFISDLGKHEETVVLLRSPEAINVQEKLVAGTLTRRDLSAFIKGCKVPA